MFIKLVKFKELLLKFANVCLLDFQKLQIVGNIPFACGSLIEYALDVWTDEA